MLQFVSLKICGTAFKGVTNKSWKFVFYSVSIYKTL